MPISPEYAESLVRAVVDIYQDAERIMLERIAKTLAADLDAPDWAEKKLIQLQLLRAQTARQLQQLTGRSAEEIAAAILKAANRGEAMALADLLDLAGRLNDAPIPPGVPAVERLVTETVRDVTATHSRILRAVDDVYRDVVAQTVPQTLLGTQTRRETAQAALDRFAAKGITGFVDTAGRHWSLEGYVNMATRTATTRASIDAHVDRLVANGQNLVQVSNAPQECKLCRPWEGKILSIAAGPAPIAGVTVEGTLEQARAAGFQHPGCRHSISLFIPGVTRPLGPTADAAGDEARQQLRYLERQTRAWKRREAVALDDVTAAKARAKVRGYQSRIRDHVTTTPAKRQPHRERLGAL